MKILIILLSILFYRCKGLVFLETYTSLDSDSLIENYLPKFLNIIKEVTGDPDYSMFNLSLKEDWNKTKKFCHSLHGKKLTNYQSNTNNKGKCSEDSDYSD